jgi:hypothetical protein
VFTRLLCSSRPISGNAEHRGVAQKNSFAEQIPADDFMRLTRIKNWKSIEEYSCTLRKLVPFADLADRQFEELVEKLRDESGPANTVLFSQGDSKNEFVYLLEGQIELRIGGSTWQTVTAGTPEALFALAHQFPRRATAIAVTPVSFLRIPGDVLASDPCNRTKSTPNHLDFRKTKPARLISEEVGIESISNRGQSGSGPEERSGRPLQPDTKFLEMTYSGRRSHDVFQSSKEQGTAEKTNESRHGILFPIIGLGLNQLKSVFTRRPKPMRQAPAASRSNQVEYGSAELLSAGPIAKTAAGKPDGSGVSSGGQTLSVEPATTESHKTSVTSSSKPNNYSRPSASTKSLFGAVRLGSTKQPGSVNNSTDPDQGLVAIPGKVLVSLYDSARIVVSPFLLDKTPVTNQAYVAFIDDSGGRIPDSWGSKGPGKNEIDHPVTGISLDEARKFSAWCGKRLPTCREWEAASRSISQYRFPWGIEWDPGRCNGPEHGLNMTTPVDKFPAGASREGCWDMVGNVWEWCEKSAGDPELDPGYSWVYGGSYRHACVHGNVISRTSVLDQNRYLYLGFRCAKDL